mgnify:CR=1 FL=1|tara:strand:- start:8324 stop:9430 length:1107 start_codon:yes stop_codon:yes gene_type:complete
MKKLRVAIFISDVGFGHMVRQREIIKVMLTNLKNVDITIINGLQIEILKETFKDKVKYIKRFNNIELMKSKEGYLDLKYTSKILNNWDQSIDESFKFFKKNFYNFNLIISDFVPEVFYFSKKLKIKCYGVCHFTWGWFFQKISKKKKITSKLQKYENMATKIFLPPFTPKGVYKNISNKKKIKEVNFIIKKEKISIYSNKKKTFLIMDSGTRSLSNLISNTIPYIKNISKYKFFIGVNSLSKQSKTEILKSKNIEAILSLKGMYSYISKVDYVITRAGFNSLTECLVSKKPSIFMNEKYNPEINENLKFIEKFGIGGLMNSQHWGKSFLQRLEYFLKYEEENIKSNLNLFDFNVNGSKQIVNSIKTKI